MHARTHGIQACPLSQLCVSSSTQRFLHPFALVHARACGRACGATSGWAEARADSQAALELVHSSCRCQVAAARGRRFAVVLLSGQHTACAAAGVAAFVSRILVLVCVLPRGTCVSHISCPSPRCVVLGPWGLARCTGALPLPALMKNATPASNGRRACVGWVGMSRGAGVAASRCSWLLDSS
jgi:hypothetical protein